MIYYNVSIHIEPEIEEQWLQWMRETHIPAMMATGCFSAHLFTRLREPVQDGTISYIVQYLAESDDQLQRYYDEYAAHMRSDGSQRFGDKFLIFRSVTESV